MTDTLLAVDRRERCAAYYARHTSAPASTRPLVRVRSSYRCRAASAWGHLVCDVRIVEPLVIDALGYVWTATGERDALGQLTYQIAPCSEPQPHQPGASQ